MDPEPKTVRLNPGDSGRIREALARMGTLPPDHPFEKHVSPERQSVIAAICAACALDPDTVKALTVDRYPGQLPILRLSLLDATGERQLSFQLTQLDVP